MNYSLAKQLKEAGFPQDPLRISLIDWVKEGKEPVVEPWLHELIEACGGFSFELHKSPFYIGGQWMAEIITENTAMEDFDNSQRITRFGSTPEEAVANLWLELNKK